MEYKDIDFEQLEQWIDYYNKYKQPKRKKQLLTLIVITCTPLIKNISYGLARRSSDPIEDIIQVANIGLIKAIKRYKSEYKNLKTFLSYTIVGEIKHYLRDKINLIRPPREIIELSYRINKISIEKLEQDGELYTKESIARSLGIKESKIEEIVNTERRHILSLDELINKADNDSKAYSDIIADKNHEEDDDNDDFEAKNYLTEAKKKLLNDAVSKLPDKLRNIVTALYYDKKNQKDLAEEMNTSQSNISRQQKRALTMLYEIITDMENDNNK